ncbi:kinesin KP1-like isoform X1 [Senna tora]|uniref:Kinesin KP1-like isoform X1 n=1 Tax=Senna tora TaxID=362788 RepID=A0A834TFW3_9FABA|nr:kinesin KP1-like isoform X1 [Senna tora]
MNKENLAEGDVLELEAEEVLAQKGANHQAVGTILSSKAVNKKVVKSLVTKAWGEPPGLTVMELGVNSFIFSFESEVMARKVLNGGPWSIMGSILNTRKWIPEVAFHEINFNLVPFWVQAHGLPLEQITQKNAERIGGQIGQVILAENPRSDDKLVRSFIRVRAFVDVSKPLITGFWAPRKNALEVWVFLKYEKLIDMCYNCGVVGHEQKACKLEQAMAVWDPSQPRYGPELSVPPAKSMSAVLLEMEQQQKKKGDLPEKTVGTWRKNPIRVDEGGSKTSKTENVRGSGETEERTERDKSNLVACHTIKVSGDPVGSAAQRKEVNKLMDWVANAEHKKQDLGPRGPTQETASAARIGLEDGKLSPGLGPMQIEDLGLEKEFIGLKEDVVIVDFPSPPRPGPEKSGTMYMHKKLTLSREEAVACKKSIAITASKEEDSDKVPSPRTLKVSSELSEGLQKRLDLKRGRDEFPSTVSTHLLLLGNGDMDEDQPNEAMSNEEARGGKSRKLFAGDMGELASSISDTVPMAEEAGLIKHPPEP